MASLGDIIKSEETNDTINIEEQDLVPSKLGLSESINAEVSNNYIDGQHSFNLTDIPQVKIAVDKEGSVTFFVPESLTGHNDNLIDTYTQELSSLGDIEDETTRGRQLELIQELSVEYTKKIYDNVTNSECTENVKVEVVPDSEDFELYISEHSPNGSDSVKLDLSSYDEFERSFQDALPEQYELITSDESIIADPTAPAVVTSVEPRGKFDSTVEALGRLENNFLDDSLENATVPEKASNIATNVVSDLVYYSAPSLEELYDALISLKDFEIGEVENIDADGHVEFTEYKNDLFVVNLSNVVSTSLSSILDLPVALFEDLTRLPEVDEVIENPILQEFFGTSAAVSYAKKQLKKWTNKAYDYVSDWLYYHANFGVDLDFEDTSFFIGIRYDDGRLVYRSEYEVEDFDGGEPPVTRDNLNILNSQAHLETNSKWKITIDPYNYSGRRNEQPPALEYPSSVLPITSYSLGGETLSSTDVELYSGTSMVIPALITRSQKITVTLPDLVNIDFYTRQPYSILRRFREDYIKYVFGDRRPGLDDASKGTWVRDWRNCCYKINITTYSSNWRVSSEKIFLAIPEIHIIQQGQSEESVDFQELTFNVVGEL